LNPEGAAMTEAEWLACPHPDPLLQYLRGRTTDRNLRLWACSCVRRIWHLIPLELGRCAVAVNERFADGEVSEREWLAVADAFAPCGLYNSAYGHPAMRAAHSALYIGQVGMTAHYARLARKRSDRDAEQLAQTELVRHIIGNPFRPPVKRATTPTITALAEALYAGEDCAFALHDALLEAGHADLAEHFRRETSHPRGCWAMDVILARE
jgi:hypothetical protein